MISAWTVHSPALWVWHLCLLVRGVRGIAMAGHMRGGPYIELGLWRRPQSPRTRGMYWAPGMAKHEGENER